MKNSLLAAGLVSVALAASAPAGAAVLYHFDPGAFSPEAGYTLINTFDTTVGITGSNFEIKTPPADGDGAPPANSSPAGTPYLSVLEGGTANIDFGILGGAINFQFDWGSIDSYNTLTIHSTGGDLVIVPGTSFPNLANGDQASPGTNGLFTVESTAGERFTGITLTSSKNSFEIDNLAVGVPEPATWAIMILGFGGVGALMRRRRLAALAA